MPAGGIEGSAAAYDSKLRPERGGKWKRTAQTGQYPQRQLRRRGFGDAIDRDGSERCMRIQRIGLHGWFGVRIARLVGDGSAARTRALRGPIFVRQTDHRS